MRKMVIALIFVLPLVFVFIIFSSLNVVSLNVNVSANGIRIKREDIEDLDEFDNLYIDIAEHKTHVLTATVMPENATNAKYTLVSSDPDTVEVDDKGNISAKREGEAVITATSNDGNYSDSITVIATSTKAYDFGVSLFSKMDEEQSDLLTSVENGYKAKVATGLYGYTLRADPADIVADIVVDGNSAAVIDEISKQILLPFTGSVSIKFTLPDGANGKIEKTVNLDVDRPESAGSGILVNGVEGENTVFIDESAVSASFYVESSSAPVFTESSQYSAEVEALGSHRYKVNVTFAQTDGEPFAINFTAGKQSAQVRFSFEQFDFNIDSNMPTESNGGVIISSIYRGSAAVFTAIPLVSAQNVTFNWTSSDNSVVLKNAQTEQVTVTASKPDAFTLTITASRDGAVLVQKEINITVVTKIISITVTGIPKNVDLASHYTIGGKTYNQNGELGTTDFPVKVITYGGTTRVDGFNDVEWETSSDALSVSRQNGAFSLSAVGTGEVTITFYWRGNDMFGKNVRASYTVNVVSDGVEVSTYSQLKKAAESGEKIVLKNDIMLGTDDEGKPLSINERGEILSGQRTTSTYNTEWYQTSSDFADQNARNEAKKITYAMEFKNNVYGNGYTINSEYFSRAVDGTGNPAFNIYREPLYFVKYKNMASVAGQDNCAFLVRTNGVTLYGVNLLGCLDSSLYKDGAYNLNNLNHVGTVLEVNASVNLINCRIRNGRNVVRAYGGNNNGENYMVNALNPSQTCENERIMVNIDGCILSQGREFILKIGANRALRAQSSNSPEPAFTNAQGAAYQTSDGKPQSNNYNLLNDSYFYDHYVLTDVTLKNSVLETSGLFAVGVESNFAGVMLAQGYNGDYSAFTTEWQKSGGTSFASVLRLEGDVRMYEWKDLSLIDSSTLIESPSGALNEWLKLDINAMFNYVYSTNEELYGGLIHTENGKQYAHGGIAFYGGGINYSQLSMENLNADIADLKQFNINISVLKDASQGNLQNEGNLLPKAAGTRDFRFYIYGADSKNFGYNRQKEDEANGNKYKGVSPVNIFVG